MSDTSKQTAEQHCGETPRTDACYADLRRTGTGTWDIAEGLADLARTLERELAAAESALAEAEKRMLTEMVSTEVYAEATARAEAAESALEVANKRLRGRYEKYVATVRAIGPLDCLSYDQWLIETDKENS